MKLDLITNKGIITENVNSNDEFYTPPYAVVPILKRIPPRSTVWCPFDTEDSLFVKMFKAAGHKVVNSHISTGEDFFQIPVPRCDCIISNPPYSLKYEVFTRLFKLNIPFAMLVGVVGLFESQKRFDMFAQNSFEIMYLNRRVSYFKDYDDVVPKLNPPFSSVYLCRNILENQIVFETINKQGITFNES